MPPGTKYTIVTGRLDRVVSVTQSLIEEGWQPSGPITAMQGGKAPLYFKEMIYIPTVQLQGSEMQNGVASQEFVDEFNKKYLAVDEKARDLLSINDIEIIPDADASNKVFTRIGDKIHAGISPTEILAALKASKHCPIDIDEQWFLNEMEKLT